MIYNVKDYGATADGRLCTRQIQDAIDACFLSGGGEVVVPEGRYLACGLRLRSNVTLHLLENAVIVGSRDPEDYAAYLDDKIEPISEEERSHKVSTSISEGGRSIYPYHRWNNAIIRAIRAKNIAIIGESGSAIDGQDCYDAVGEEEYRGPHGINMWYCEKVLLSGYSLYNTGNWGHAIHNSTDITVKGISVYGGHDGFDARTCDNILIEDSTFLTGDDCIAGFDNINVTVRRCVFNSACSIFRFGGSHVLIENCTGTAPAKYGFRKGLSTEKKILGAPTDENCRYNCHTVFLYYCDYRAFIRELPGDIIMRNCDFDGVDAIFNLPFGHKWACNKSLDNITFKDCSFKGLHLPLSILAPEGEPLTLTMENCKVGYADDYGDAPFITASGHRLISLKNINILEGTSKIEATGNGQIVIEGLTVGNN